MQHLRKCVLGKVVRDGGAHVWCARVYGERLKMMMALEVESSSLRCGLCAELVHLLPSGHLWGKL